MQIVKRDNVEASNNVDQDNNSNNNDDSQVKGLIRKTRKMKKLRWKMRT